MATQHFLCRECSKAPGLRGLFIAWLGKSTPTFLQEVGQERDTRVSIDSSQLWTQNWAGLWEGLS